MEFLLAIVTILAVVFFGKWQCVKEKNKDLNQYLDEAYKQNSEMGEELNHYRNMEDMRKEVIK